MVADECETKYGHGVLYREDLPDVRRRLAEWWGGGDLGRPPVAMYVKRQESLEELPSREAPGGWTTDYSVTDFDYRVHLLRTAPARDHYLGEAMPVSCPDLAPNCLALYLGCHGVDGIGTVYCEPCIDEDDPTAHVFRFDEENAYWRFTQRLAAEAVRLAAGRNVMQFPDLIEGLDTLAAMRGNENLLYDLVDEPDWVHASLATITDLYFQYYDRLYGMLKDETGGSFFWAWGPGRIAKLQCDFSAMIGPDMFGEFMKPVLGRMAARLDQVIYHWDGPDAIPHLPHLLAVDGIDMIQWTPGAGQPPLHDERWLPLYRRILDGGKRVMLLGVPEEGIAVLKREFGKDLKRFYLSTWTDTIEHAERIIDSTYVG